MSGRRLASWRRWRGATGAVGGGYDMVTVRAEAGSVKLVRRRVVAEGVNRPGVR